MSLPFVELQYQVLISQVRDNHTKQKKCGEEALTPEKSLAVMATHAVFDSRTHLQAVEETGQRVSSCFCLLVFVAPVLLCTNDHWFFLYKPSLRHT